MHLAALGAQQRIDAQRPVQHEVVDQGGADKRKKYLGHDRAGKNGGFPMELSNKVRHYPARTEGGPDMKIPQSRQARLWDRFTAARYLMRWPGLAPLSGLSR